MKYFRTKNCNNKTYQKITQKNGDNESKLEDGLILNKEEKLDT